MSNKAQLKSIADSVKQSKWDDVIQKSKDFLERDSKSHQAYAPTPSLFLSSHKLLMLA